MDDNKIIERACELAEKKLKKQLGLSEIPTNEDGAYTEEHQVIFDRYYDEYFDQLHQSDCQLKL